MSDERFDDIWEALEISPADAENLRLRASLMMEIKAYIAREGLTQAKAAKLLGVTQPRISDLLRGKIELFALDGLVTMIALTGQHIELRVSRAA